MEKVASSSVTDYTTCGRGEEKGRDGRDDAETAEGGRAGGVMDVTRTSPG